MDKAGLKDFRFHDLRHSAASYLAMNGASLAEIAKVLGHKTLAMVKRYAHLSEAHTAGVVHRQRRFVQPLLLHSDFSGWGGQTQQLVEHQLPPTMSASYHPALNVSSLLLLLGEASMWG